MSTSQLTTLELSNTGIIWEGYIKQGWQCTYKVTLCRVRVMFIHTLRRTMSLDEGAYMAR